jgi:hypothetical protein
LWRNWATLLNEEELAGVQHGPEDVAAVGGVGVVGDGLEQFLFLGGGPAAEEAEIDGVDDGFGTFFSGLVHRTGDDGVAVHEVAEDLAVQQHERLAHAGIVVGVFDELAIALAELAQEVAVGRRAAEIGSAQHVGVAEVFPGDEGGFFIFVIDLEASGVGGEAGLGLRIELGTALLGQNVERLVHAEVFAFLFELEHGGDFLGKLFILGEFIQLAFAGEFGKALEPDIIDHGVHGFVDALALALDGLAGGADGGFVLGLGGGLHGFLGGAHFSGEFFLLLSDGDGAGLELLRSEAVERTVEPFDAAQGDLGIHLGGDAGSVGGGLVEGDHAVPDLLGAHAAEEGAGEVVNLAEFDVLGVGFTLVGLRIEDGAQEGLHVVIGGLHRFFEESHELGIARHGAVGDFIDGFDDALAHELFPQAVGDDGGEARVVLARHPAGVGSDGLGAVLHDLAVLAEGGGDEGLDLLVGLGVGVLIVVRQQQGLFARLIQHGVVAQRAEDFGHGAADVLALDALRQAEFCNGTTVTIALVLGRAAAINGLGQEGIGEAVAAGHAVGVGRHLVVVHLRPFIERVVVALGADHAGAEKDLGGDRHVIQRHVEVADVEADGAVFVALAVGGDDFAHHLVVGLVGAQAVLEPFGVTVKSGQALAATDHLALHAQDVGPVVVKILYVAVTSEELVDQLLPFVGLAAFEEFGGLLQGGDAACDIEIDAADEDCIAGGLVGLDFLLRELGVDEFVNLGGGGLQIGGGVGQQGRRGERCNNGTERIQLHEHTEGGWRDNALLAGVFHILRHSSVHLSEIGGF